MKLKPVPKIGGIILFGSFIIFSLLNDFFVQHSNYFVAGLVLVVFGFGDDIFEFKPFQKLIGQFIIVSSFVFFEYNINNISSYLLSYFLMMNSSNLIDGSDGVLGTLSIISLTYLYFYIDQNSFILFFIISIVVILFFNFPNAIIYLGESGSTVIGFTMNYIILYDINMSSSFVINNFLILSKCISIYPIPILDVFRVLCFRLYNKRNIFTKDLNHVHHLVLNMVVSKTRALIILGLSQAVLIFVFEVFKFYFKL